MKLGPNQINTNPRFLEKLVHYSFIGADPGVVVAVCQQRISGGKRRRRGKGESEPVIGIGVMVKEEFGDEKNERRHWRWEEDVIMNWSECERRNGWGWGIINKEKDERGIEWNSWIAYLPTDFGRWGFFLEVLLIFQWLCDYSLWRPAAVSFSPPGSFFCFLQRNNKIQCWRFSKILN